MAKKFTRIALFLVYFLLAGCDSSDCSFAGCPLPAESPDGVWVGQSGTEAELDVFTSFEFDAVGPFTVGASPFTATFSTGNAESRSVPSFYISGLNSWHVLIATSASVTFETLPSSVNFHVRTENATDVAEIQIFDQISNQIQMIVPNDVFQEVTINRGPGQTLIGSVIVTSTSGGDVVIDDFTFGYAESTTNIDCVVAITNELACTVIDATSSNLIASAQASLLITNGNQVSGSGTLYATPGFTLNDGSAVADLTILDGTVVTNSTLDLIVDAAGRTLTILTTFDAIYNRGSDLATVAAVYSTFDIYGDPSSFIIDASGAISGQSNSGCVLTGQVSIIDAAFNAYDVTLDVASCGGFDGMYDGLGTTRDSFAMDDLFEIAVFTAQKTIVGTAEK
ncbi:MAG: hypothetical protein O7G31_10875 [Calditrichaeota bacterium]|nr:hypothetical protein [Calditrichota bacterium]